jgi:hypothetical protein
MEVFLDMLLSVHLADRRLGNNMISIVEAIMLDVMAQGRTQKRQCVEVVEVCLLFHTLVCKDEVNMLCDIGSMHVVMVLNRPLVLVVDLSEVLKELVEVDDLE